MQYTQKNSDERILLMPVKIPSITPHLNHNASNSSFAIVFQRKSIFHLNIVIFYTPI